MERLGDDVNSMTSDEGVGSFGGYQNGSALLVEPRPAIRKRVSTFSDNKFFKPQNQLTH